VSLLLLEGVALRLEGVALRLEEVVLLLEGVALGDTSGAGVGADVFNILLDDNLKSDVFGLLPIKHRELHGLVISLIRVITIFKLLVRLDTLSTL
jgi:hypothetical protein